MLISPTSPQPPIATFFLSNSNMVLPFPPTAFVDRDKNTFCEAHVCIVPSPTLIHEKPFTLTSHACNRSFVHSQIGASSSSTHVHSQQCSPSHAPNRYWIDALQEIRNWSKICIVCNFNYFPMLLCLRVLFISWEEVFLSKSLWHNDVRNGLRFEALNWWSCGGCKREIKEEREKNELLVPLEITFDDAARWSEAMPVVYVVEWLFLQQGR